MPRVIVIGGGLAGMAAAAALGESGYQVQVFETRAFLGGRAASYPYNPVEQPSELIDNCQHVLLRCCVNLLDFYRRLGVEDRIQFHREFYFLEPGGRVSRMAAGWLPAPAHFATSFLGLKFLTFEDKRAIARAMLALRREHGRRHDLDLVTMADWLRDQGQTRGAVERFWRPVLVSAVNEELDRMAASHGFQVFWLGFLAKSNTYEMGIPSIGLGELYSEDRWRQFASVALRPRMSVDRLIVEDGKVRAAVAGGVEHTADYYVSAVPFERFGALAPEAGISLKPFHHSSITGVHLWFDRPVTDLPHGALLDRTMQWFFNKRDGRYLQLVVSASESLVKMPREKVISLARRELAEFLPGVHGAKLEKAHVVKEVRATFSAAPGLERHRPHARTKIANLFLAGDWTSTGWPSTMEGAVRSGYLAAEAVTASAGAPSNFLIPDVA